MGHEARARKASKVMEHITRGEIQRAEVDLMVRCGAVLFRRGFFGRLKWLFLGR